LPHAAEVLPSNTTGPNWIADDLACERVGQPEASLLISRHALCSSSDRFDVASANAAVLADRREGQFTAVAEVHDMLTRAVQDPGRFAGRERRVGMGLDRRSGRHRAHGPRVAQ